MDHAVEERRHAPRCAGPLGPWARARVRPGLDVTIVDLASGGVLVEGATRLLPGSRVVLQFGAAGRGPLVTGLVLRCEVVAVDRDRGIRYRGAVRFDGPVEVPGEGPTRRG